MTTSTSQEYASDTAVAIIGMAGRFPGAANVDEFWRNLVGGVTSIVSFSDQELTSAGVELALLQHPSYVKAGAVVKDVASFDAGFFGFTPREAETMDPQHRLFLECAWEALEHAACDPETYKGLIGIFAGSGFCTYLLNNLFPNPDIVDLIGKLQ